MACVLWEWDLAADNRVEAWDRDKAREWVVISRVLRVVDSGAEGNREARAKADSPVKVENSLNLQTKVEISLYRHSKWHNR